MKFAPIIALAATFSMTAMSAMTATAAVAPPELSCTIKGSSMSCQIVGKDRRVMDSDDVSRFIDASDSGAYLVLKSRKGMERTFMIDSRSAQFKKLRDIKNSASMSDIATAKAALFNELEKKVIKLSDDLDAQSGTAEFVLWDPSIGFEKARKEARDLQTEVDGFRKNRDSVCTTTPAFEAVTKSSARLQQSLSQIVLSWQTPGTCMSTYSIYKGGDGAVDLRQVDSAADFYKSHCKTSEK